MRTFVLDTSGLLPAMFDSKDLTRLGRAIIDLAEDYQAELVVPTFALVEAELQIRRSKRIRQTFQQFLAAIMERDYMRIEPLGTEQVALLPTLLAIPELHDRIIVAHALTNDAPLMTSDHVIRESGLVETVW
ncbi:MAG TPA: PIN domain-containing protein [Chloroflexota bacterium]|nr:PIN domain-containing protein [Chloroflexota bacterium]